MLPFLVPTISLFMGYLQLRSHAELVSLEKKVLSVSPTFLITKQSILVELFIV